jgi:hypothetical protein
LVQREHKVRQVLRGHSDQSVLTAHKARQENPALLEQ